MKPHVLVVAALTLLFGSLGQVKADIIYDPAADFSTTNNPNGVWRYGWSETLGSAFIFDTDFHLLSGVQQWRGDLGSDGTPLVFHNGTGSTQVFAGTVSVPAGALGEHPGPGGQDALLRFTAPNSGNYSITGSFSGFDFVGPTTTDVHVLVNGVSKFDGAVSGFGPGSAVPFQIDVTLAAGDIVDFAVGVGTDGSDLFDSTGLATTITQVIPQQGGGTAVPEPASLSLFCLGGLTLLGCAWRRFRLKGGSMVWGAGG